MRSVVEREFGRWSGLAAGDWQTNSEDADQPRRYSVLLDKRTLSFPQRVPPDTTLLYPAGLSQSLLYEYTLEDALMSM